MEIKQVPVRVVLHCSDTPDSNDSIYGIEDIRRWHVEDFGFYDIGYHWYITRSGRIWEGRPENVRGAHAGKNGNEDSIGICYEGTWRPTEEQINSILNLFQQIRRSWNISAHNWHGHYEFNPRKTCPGFSMELFKRLLPRC